MQHNKVWSYHRGTGIMRHSWFTIPIFVNQAERPSAKFDQCSCSGGVPISEIPWRATLTCSWEHLALCLVLETRQCWAGVIEAANLGRGRINVSGPPISSAARRFQGAPEGGLPTGFRRSAIQQFRDLQTGELHSGHASTDSEPNLSALQHLQIGAQEPTPSNLGPYEASFLGSHSAKRNSLSRSLSTISPKWWTVSSELEG